METEKSFQAFISITDPRTGKNKLHKLIDIIIISICATICNADGWEEIEEFGKIRQKWFETFLELPHGIPSHDTFARIISKISPKEFNESFQKWINLINEKLDYRQVAIDGKTLRRSFDHKNSKNAIHMVSAWVADNSVVLGQVKVDEKSNEITAIPQLLDMLFLDAAVVTIDAMGCQKDIAKKIIDKEADYVLALKGNQGTLHEDVKLFLDELSLQENGNFDYHKTVDRGHGRHEVRQHWITTDIDWLENRKKWAGLNSIGLVRSERTVKGKTSIENRYFISSLSDNAINFGQAVRRHWSIENQLHWTLDIAFNEDDNRIRKNHAPENLAVLRHLALSLLKNEKSTKKGVKAKRKRAAWDDTYLETVLMSFKNQ